MIASAGFLLPYISIPCQVAGALYFCLGVFFVLAFVTSEDRGKFRVARDANFFTFVFFWPIYILGHSIYRLRIKRGGYPDEVDWSPRGKLP